MIKNIVIVNDFNYIQGGASKVAVETANILSASGKYNVYFFSGCSKETNELKSNIINICTSQGEALKDKNKIRGCINGIYNFKAKKELKKLLLKLDKDNTIIHVHGWTKCLSSSVFDIAFKMKFKIALTLHDYFVVCPNGGYFNYKKNEICKYNSLSWKCIRCNCDSRNYAFKIYRIVRQFVQNKIVKLDDKITDVITISDFSENIFKNNFNSKITMHRIYNPINLYNNSKHSDYRKNKYFLYVGRVSKEKGVDIFCEAITKANENGIVVGNGSEFQLLKEKYSNIKFVGWKNSNEVKKYMQNAKCLIFPSKLYETMGMTVVEAISCEIPVIANINTAASDFIIDGKNGFLYNSEEQLIDCMKRINQLNYYNNKKDLLKFSNNAYLEKIVKLYEIMCQK